MQRPGRVLRLLLLLFLGWPISALAAIQLRANRSVVAAGETVQLEIILPGESGTPGPIRTTPNVPIRQIGRSSSVSVVNGNVSRKTSIKYLLQTSVPGSITVLPIPVKLSGGTEYTNPIRIVVQEAEAGQTLEVTATVVPTVVVEGQAFELVVYILHGSQQIPRSWTPPTGSGIEMWPGEKDARQQTSVVSRGGQRFELLEIRRWMLATRPGVLTLSGGTLTVEGPQRRRRRDPFDPFGMFGNRRNQSNRTIPGARLLVTALPTPPAHIQFAGLIGSFASRWRVRQKQANRVSALLLLDGDGSVPALNFSPWIQNGWQVYPDKPEIRRSIGRDGKPFAHISIPATLVPATDRGDTVPGWYDPIRKTWIRVSLPVGLPLPSAVRGKTQNRETAASAIATTRMSPKRTKSGIPKRWFPLPMLSFSSLLLLLSGSVFLLLLLLFPRHLLRRRFRWQSVVSTGLRRDSREQWEGVFTRLQQIEGTPVALLSILSDHLFAPDYHSPTEAIRTWMATEGKR